MQKLTTDGQRVVEGLAQRHGFGEDAVIHMLFAMLNGNGAMAQFSHPEFAGAGQWMKGGMLMLSDMFNHALKARVDALCRDISVILASEPGLFVADAGRWPPPELGRPSATGSQNQVRYAYFDRARRLAVEVSGRVSVYDTLDHHIRGFSQQQGGTGTVLFTSQRGTVELSTLPLVSVDGRPAPQPEPGSGTSSKSGEDAFAAIERLGKLHADGLLTDEEFADKKAELLRRI